MDLGIADDHRQLEPYRRGNFVTQNARPVPVGHHGALVASRVVFGDCPSDVALSNARGACSFYDARVGEYAGAMGQDNLVNDKIVMDAIRGVRGAAPDVRVYNLSFGDARPLGVFPEVLQREKRILLQDLDNFAFANDVVIVVAAGNSNRGVIPSPAYPRNFEDPQWELGPWACGFNTLVCGSVVNRVSVEGLVRTSGWPSPFSRIGPGLCDSPVPSFCAPGGNTDEAYGYRAGLGVWGFSNEGFPEDHPGTSYAAPILARGLRSRYERWRPIALKAPTHSP